jgi:RNA polymerase sigma factor (TIGR02999 family)
MTLHGAKSSVDVVPLTAWLRAASDGDQAAGERAYKMVYAELRRLAGLQIEQNSAQTLTPTALVSETYLKLGSSIAELRDRQHFFNLAARAMRQTVIDYAREHQAKKRGGQFLRTNLDENTPDRGLDAEQALAIEQALTALENQDAQLAQTLSLTKTCQTRALMQCKHWQSNKRSPH